MKKTKSFLLILLCLALSSAFAQSRQYKTKLEKEKDELAIELSRNGFTDLETEKVLIDSIESLFQTAIALDSSNLELMNKKLIKILTGRAIKMTEYSKENVSPALLSYIETVYSKALALDPENTETNYSFGAFYYNRAVVLAKQTVDDKERENNKKEAIELFKKAKPFLEKAMKKQSPQSE